MSLPTSIVQAIKQATVVPATAQLGDLSDALDVYYDIRSWLEDFEEILRKHQWKQATNLLCMLGVDDPERKPSEDELARPSTDPTLVWLNCNQALYNGLVAQVICQGDLAEQTQALASLRAHVRQDIRKHESGHNPEIFAIPAHACWVADWLEQL